MNRHAKWLKWGPSICFLLILSMMTLDWLTKHILYIEQREILYNLIHSGVTQIDEHKKIVAYLQGVATRRLNDLVEMTVLFGIVFFLHYLSITKFRRDHHA